MGAKLTHDNKRGLSLAMNNKKQQRTKTKT